MKTAFLIVLIVAAGISCIAARHSYMANCGQHIHSVPPEKWHGGNAPVHRMPKGCP